MSEVFEGIVVRASHDVVEEQLRRYGAGMAMRSEALGDELTVCFRTAQRDQMVFSEEWGRLAADLSEPLGSLLVVRFDSRESHRSSTLYRGGRLERSYGEEDELFVPLDSEGMPLSGMTPVTVADREPEEEYETAVNAIELGLRDLGAGDWPRLLELIVRTA